MQVSSRSASPGPHRRGARGLPVTSSAPRPAGTWSYQVDCCCCCCCSCYCYYESCCLGIPACGPGIEAASWCLVKSQLLSILLLHSAAVLLVYDPVAWACQCPAAHDSQLAPFSCAPKLACSCCCCCCYISRWVSQSATAQSILGTGSCDAHQAAFVTNLLLYHRPAVSVV
jgi:hypothetical protein